MSSVPSRTSRVGTSLRAARRAVVHRVAMLFTFALALGVLVVLILAALGLWMTPVAPATNVAPPTTTTTAAPVKTVATDTAPAQTAVDALLTDLHLETRFKAGKPSFATTDPLLAGCDASTIPVAQISRSLTLSSASLQVVANVDVYGAGLGALVVANTLTSTLGCSGNYVLTTSPGGLDGFVASSADVAGSSILDVTFRRGDVVISLYAFPTNYQSDITLATTFASAIDTQLAPLISSTCVDENAPLIAARRNPTQSNYRPYTSPIILTPPTRVTRPDLNLLNAPLPVVAKPPRGSVTSPPTPPVAPTVSLTATIPEPVKDTVGPGCGWAFTAMTAPAVAPSAVPLGKRKAAALARLEKSWTQWPTTVTAYLEAQAVYLRDLVSYSATIATTTTTTTSTTTTTTTIPATTTSQSTTTTSAPPPG